MTQDHTIQILWDAIEKRDRAVIEEDANIRKSYDMGNTNVDAYRFKRNWLEKELSALHEVTTAILGYPSRMTVVDAYYGLPWDHDEFRYQGRVVTGIEESRDQGYFILYLEVSDECKVTGNTWLNRKPSPAQPAPAVKLTSAQRELVMRMIRQDGIFLINKSRSTKFLLDTGLIERKWDEARQAFYWFATDAGKRALEGGAS